MPAITAIAWLNFIAAGVLALMAFAGNLFLISPAVAAVISGFLFLAIDRAITLLTEIRDRLPAPVSTSEQTHAQPTGPIRSIAEVEADLAKMKDRINA